jgi:putative ABC transport system substrate-binding protein
VLYQGKTGVLVRRCLLPVEQPTQFELMNSLETARALWLAIPESILIQADPVIQ